jgi:uncharacterized protein (TIGR00645 family)
MWHLIHAAPSLTEQTIMLIVLGLIDVVMISNLLVMVIVGGYETFVSRSRLEGHPDQPEWLSHVNVSVLRVKLAITAAATGDGALSASEPATWPAAKNMSAGRVQSHGRSGRDATGGA